MTKQENIKHLFVAFNQKDLEDYIGFRMNIDTSKNLIVLNDATFNKGAEIIDMHCLVISEKENENEALFSQYLCDKFIIDISDILDKAQVEYKFSWNDFDSGKTYINCQTEEDAIILLAYLTGKGYTWVTGSKLLPETEWNTFREKTYYACDEDKELICWTVNPVIKNKVVKFNMDMII